MNTFRLICRVVLIGIAFLLAFPLLLAGGLGKAILEAFDSLCDEVFGRS